MGQAVSPDHEPETEPVPTMETRVPAMRPARTGSRPATAG